ncbi:MAG: ribonuclease P protein component [Evtepia sp.]
MEHTVSLKENRQFRRLYAKGKTVAGPYLAIYCRRNGAKESRLGITVSGKLGNAVVRNKLRRRLREAYRTHETQYVAGYDIVVVARRKAVFGRYTELVRDLLRLSRKLNLIREETP